MSIYEHNPQPIVISTIHVNKSFDYVIDIIILYIGTKSINGKDTFLCTPNLINSLIIMPYILGCIRIYYVYSNNILRNKLCKLCFYYSILGIETLYCT